MIRSKRVSKAIATALVMATAATTPAFAAAPASPAGWEASIPAGYVPLRAVAEAAGAQVHWDAQTWTAYVSGQGVSLTVRFGEQTAQLNGRTISLSKPVTLMVTRLLVPADLMVEAGLVAPEWAAQLEAFTQQLGVGTIFPGMALGLAQNGEPTYLKGLGFRNLEQKLPVTPDTVMGLGSTTKTFTAVAIMQLQDAGKLSVKDPVTKYLPTYRTSNPEWTAETTIHHLLTHSAGLAPMPLLFSAMHESLVKDPNAAPQLKALPPITTADALLEAIAAFPLPPVGKPGQYMSYSNESYALLGEIIARVSGMSYEEYITKNILVPAGMTHTMFDDASMAATGDYTTLYSVVPSAESPLGVAPMADPVWWDGTVMNAAGFLRSSVNDMLRFSEIFRTGGLVGETRILSSKAVAAMTTPYVEAETGVYYGYGLFVRPDFHGTKLVEHAGSNKGQQARLVVLPEKGLAAVGLTNVGGAPVELAVSGVLNLALGLPVTAPAMAREPFTVDAAKLNEYVGTYAGGEAAPATFSVVDGALVFEQAGLKFPAQAIGEDEFGVAVGASVLNVKFHRGADGKVFAIRIGYRVWVKL